MLRLIACLFAISTATVSHAAAAVVQFEAGGFFGGGAVSGSFEGVDEDGDGFIRTSELTAFRLDFSGGDALAAFSLEADGSSVPSSQGRGLRFDDFLFEVGASATEALRFTVLDTEVFDLAEIVAGSFGVSITAFVRDGTVGRTGTDQALTVVSPVPVPPVGLGLLLVAPAILRRSHRRA